MQTFLDFLSEKKIDVSKFITHIFNLQDAEKAYDLIVDRKEQFLAVLIEYENEKKIDNCIRFDIKKPNNDKT